MRWLTEEEKPATRVLWQEMFPEDSEAFLDYYYREKVPDSDISAEEDAGELVSMIQWNPYPLWVRGNHWDSRYLVGVATRPSHRHRGLMASQIRGGLAHWRRQGMPFVWLMPADPAIYQPFGFRYVYRQWEGRLPESGEAVLEGNASAALSGLQAIPGREETAWTFRALEPEEDGWAAAFLMEELSRRYRVFPERTAAYLSRLRREVASENGGLAVAERNGQPAAFVAFWPEEEAVEVREMVLAETALPDILRLGRTETPEIRRRRAGLLDALRHYLAELYPRQYSRESSRIGGMLPVKLVNTGWLGEARPAIMARIVHLERFLSAIRSCERRTVRLQVYDPLLPENQGIFRWQLGPEGSRLIQAAGETPELTLGMEELAEWLLGGAERPGYETVQTLEGGFFPEIV